MNEAVGLAGKDVGLAGNGEGHAGKDVDLARLRLRPQKSECGVNASEPGRSGEPSGAR